MKFLLSVCCCLVGAAAFAQPGIAEMHQAKQDLSSSFFSAFDCCMVLAVLFGLFGGLRVYHNWQMGKDRIDSAVAAWFFASFFMILSGPFLRALFGI
jgi:succinate dehydrogenase/fumarate reductase cytochrome b subunit